MSVTISPANTSEILAQQPAELRKLARQAMKEAAGVAAQHMRDLAPGSIGEHIEERVGGGVGEVTGTVFPAGRIAKWVDEGTGEYVEFHAPITPTTSRRAANPRAALKLGDGVYRRSVRGQRGQHFVHRAEELAEPQVQLLLERPAGEITAMLAR